MFRPAETAPEPSAVRPAPRAVATLYCLLVGLAGLGVLGAQVARGQGQLHWPSMLVFAGLSLLIQRSSFNFGSPIVHSLSGVIDVAAVLALGPTAGAVVAALSGLSYLIISAVYHRRWTLRALVEIPVFNAGLKAAMALVCGAAFEAIAGPLPVGSSGPSPVQSWDLHTLLAVGAVSLLWFVLDHIGWGILDYLDGGRARLHAFFQSAIPYSLLVELLPLPCSLFVALVYTQLSRVAFVLLAAGIVAVAVLAQRWADARNELVQRVAELVTIEEVGRAIAEAHLDVDELCELIYEHASRIADASNFQLGLFEGEDYAIKLWIRDGQPGPKRSFRLTPGAGLVNWLRTSKQPILVRDFQKEMDSLPAKPTYVSDAPPRSAVFVPLIAGETVLGTLSIQSTRRNAYGASDLRVLSAMANQTAVAIQKAQLYDQERKRARQLETIGQISRQVSAYLELDELFRRTVRLIRESFGYYHVAIFTADPEHQTVTFQASASAGERDVAFDVVWGQGLIGWVAASGQALLVNDVKNEPRYLCVEALDETRSELAVPLLVETDLIGLLDVQSDQLDAFGPDDFFILETMGDQIAMAMQEARLFQEVTKQERMKQELDVARRIQTSFLPECCPKIEGWELATVWRSAREVSGDFYDFIPLPPRWGQNGEQVSRSGVVIADVADKGVPAALFMALCRTLVRTMAMDGRSPSEVIRRSNDLILADSQAGVFVTLVYTILNSDSGEIEFVNAGHLPVLLVRADDGVTEELRTDGMAVGVLPGIEFEQRSTRLEGGDLLVLYTDGVIEAQDSEQGMFGKKRLIETVQACRAQSPEAVAQAIDDAVAAFVGDAPQFDDFTLVVAKRSVQ